MRRHSRARLRLARGLRLLAIAIAALWFATSQVGWTLRHPCGRTGRMSVSLGDGQIDVRYRATSPITTAPNGWSVMTVEGSWGFQSPSASLPKSGGIRARIPLWMLFLPPAWFSTYVLLTNRRSLYPPDCCGKCGHNLRGVVSSHCGECHAPIRHPSLLIVALPAAGWANYWEHWTRR